MLLAHQSLGSFSKIKESILRYQVSPKIKAQTHYDILKLAYAGNDEAITYVVQQSIHILSGWVRSIERPSDERLDDMLEEAILDLVRALAHTPPYLIVRGIRNRGHTQFTKKDMTIQFFVRGKERRIKGWVKKFLVRTCRPTKITSSLQERIQPAMQAIRRALQELGEGEGIRSGYVTDAVVERAAAIVMAGKRGKNQRARVLSRAFEKDKSISEIAGTLRDVLDMVHFHIPRSLDDASEPRRSHTIRVKSANSASILTPREVEDAIIAKMSGEDKEPTTESELFRDGLLHKLRVHSHWACVTPNERMVLWLVLGAESPIMAIDEVAVVTGRKSRAVRDLVKSGYAKLRQISKEEPKFTEGGMR